jgi:pSer/pThr/pTyr-binding forkhead associated (FHA) protein
MPDPRSQTRRIQLSDAAKNYLRQFGVDPQTPPAVRSSIMQVDQLFKVYLLDVLGKKYAVNKDKFSIGGEADNDCIIAKDSVSRHHAAIHKDANGVFWLTDLGSTNGTFLNQTQVTAPVSLKNGDEIYLADQKFTFRKS